MPAGRCRRDGIVLPWLPRALPLASRATRAHAHPPHSNFAASYVLNEFLHFGYIIKNNQRLGLGEMLLGGARAQACCCYSTAWGIPGTCAAPHTLPHPPTHPPTHWTLVQGLQYVTVRAQLISYALLIKTLYFLRLSIFSCLRHRRFSAAEAATGRSCVPRRDPLAASGVIVPEGEGDWSEAAGVASRREQVM